MLVNEQRAGEFWRRLQPVSGEYPSPFSSPLATLRAANLRRRQRTSGTLSKPKSLPNSPGAWYCNCSAVLIRHNAMWASKNNHVQRGVNLDKSLQTIMDMSKQTISPLASVCALSPLKGTSRQDSKRVGRGDNRKPLELVHPVACIPYPFRHGILDGPSGLVRGSRQLWNGRRVNRAFFTLNRMRAQPIVLVGSPCGAYRV